MAKTSFQGRHLIEQQLMDWMQEGAAFSGRILNQPRVRRMGQRLWAMKEWLLGTILLGWLLLWQWQLVMSVGVGVMVMVLVYLGQQGQLRVPSWGWLWRPAYRSLTLASITGAIAVVSAYLSLSIWAEAGGSWLAIATILQGLGLLAVLSLVGWQVVNSQSHKFQSTQADQQKFLTDLADGDALKRLIAIHQLTAWATTTRPTESERPTLCLSAHDLADCFRLMLNRETEPAVCSALLDSLRKLRPSSHSLEAGTAALAMGERSPLASHRLDHRLDAHRVDAQSEIG